ncbi:Synaptobrevin family protein [Cryptosporidium meleagridis]|uniref:Synaptobrevin family protein n=1 Tax=Cryptosporidium meleagridis TaxID=93969 RepID=A0A2P4Z1R3_9CRYT|nr:Synaptobrevin family protein [Cryptosporidium meleagridis]
MKLLSVLLYKWDKEHPILLTSNYNLQDYNFFQRKTIQEHIAFHSRLLCSRVQEGNRVTVTFPQDIGHCHIYISNNGLGICCVTSPDYPVRCAFSLLNEYLKVYMDSSKNYDTLLSSDFNNKNIVTKDQNESIPECDEIFKRYQDPINNDKIFKVQKDLDEVRDVMLKNIEDLLHRGETLDTLMQKSSDLSAASYQFYRSAKKNNQCCQLY